MKRVRSLVIAACATPTCVPFQLSPVPLSPAVKGFRNALTKRTGSCSRTRPCASDKLRRPSGLCGGGYLHATQELSLEEDTPVKWAQGCELNSQGKVMLKGLLFSETEKLLQDLGEKPGKAEVLSSWLYRDKRLIRDLDEAVGGDKKDRSRPLGRKTRDKIGAIATADGGIRFEDVQLAADGTRKLVSVLTSGEGEGKKVETVIIPMLRGPKRQPRYTICVSSQVGCAMNCQFCFTGRLGLMANLQTAQMVEQVVAAKRFLEGVGDTVPVTGVVFMGMGEPFDNFDRVMRAVKILTDTRAGVRLKGSSVTVSTVGLVPQIDRFCDDLDNRASLAISLHSVNEDVRNQLIPVNRRYPLPLLSETLRRHFPQARRRDPNGFNTIKRQIERVELLAVSPTVKGSGSGGSAGDGEATGESKPPPESQQNRHHKPGRRKARILAVEYTLLAGVNDSSADADSLAEWLEGINCVVNLITFNPHQGTPFATSSVEATRSFRRRLIAKGMLCTIRDSRGDDEMAACGQLGGETLAGSEPRKPIPVAWKADKAIL